LEGQSQQQDCFGKGRKTLHTSRLDKQKVKLPGHTCKMKG